MYTPRSAAHSRATSRAGAGDDDSTPPQRPLPGHYLTPEQMASIPGTLTPNIPPVAQNAPVISRVRTASTASPDDTSLELMRRPTTEIVPSNAQPDAFVPTRVRPGATPPLQALAFAPSTPLRIPFGGSSSADATRESGGSADWQTTTMGDDLANLAGDAPRGISREASSSLADNSSWGFDRSRAIEMQDLPPSLQMSPAVRQGHGPDEGLARPDHAYRHPAPLKAHVNPMDAGPYLVHPHEADASELPWTESSAAGARRRHAQVYDGDLVVPSIDGSSQGEGSVFGDDQAHRGTYDSDINLIAPRPAPRPRPTSAETYASTTFEPSRLDRRPRPATYHDITSLLHLRNDVPAFVPAAVAPAPPPLPSRPRLAPLPPRSEIADWRATLPRLPLPPPYAGLKAWLYVALAFVVCVTVIAVLASLYAGGRR